MYVRKIMLEKECKNVDVVESRLKERKGEGWEGGWDCFGLKKYKFEWVIVDYLCKIY